MSTDTIANTNGHTPPRMALTKTLVIPAPDQPEPVSPVSAVPGTPTARPWWLTGPCPDWCIVAHSDADMADDRSHHGALDTLDLSLHEPIERPGGVFGPDFVTLTFSQHIRETEPTLYIDDERGHPIKLTVDEAERLSTLLGQYAYDMRFPEEPHRPVHEPRPATEHPAWCDQYECDAGEYADGKHRTAETMLRGDDRHIGTRVGAVLEDGRTDPEVMVVVDGLKEVVDDFALAYLTPGQARALADALLSYADVAEGHTS